MVGGYGAAGYVATEHALSLADPVDRVAAALRRTASVAANDTVSVSKGLRRIAGNRTGKVVVLSGRTDKTTSVAYSLGRVRSEEATSSSVSRNYTSDTGVSDNSTYTAVADPAYAGSPKVAADTHLIATAH